MDVPVAYCVHDDYWFLEASIRSFSTAGPVLVFVSRIAWDGTIGNWELAANAAKAAGAEVQVDNWRSETEQRRSVLQELMVRGASYALIPDGDEIIEECLLANLLEIASNAAASRAYVTMDTYWKSTEFVIRPREHHRPVILLDTRKVQHIGLREYQGGEAVYLGPEFGVLHHLSYAGPNDRIERKIRTFSHSHEIVRGWFSEVWTAWDDNKTLENLHPTCPWAYASTVEIETPLLLRDVQLALDQEAHGPRE